MSFTTTPANDFNGAADEAARGRLMAEWSIVHQGRHYHYAGYRYERLADAVAYAQLGRARQPSQEDFSVFDRIDSHEPTNADRELMRELSISFQNYAFVFEGFRYDKLSDAANYARHRRQLGVSPL